MGSRCTRAAALWQLPALFDPEGRALPAPRDSPLRRPFFSHAVRSFHPGQGSFLLASCVPWPVSTCGGGMRDGAAQHEDELGLHAVRREDPER